MLHAAIKKKTSRWLKEVGSTENIRIPREDEITSTIFGPLNYLEAKYVYLFIKSIININDIDNVINDTTKKIEVKIQFWPSRKHNYKGENIRTEPDILFEFKVDNKKEVFIFELKWGNNSYQEDQIEKEWNAYKIPTTEGEAHLIYIAKFVEKFKVFKTTKNKNWLSISWLNLSNNVRELKKQIENKIESKELDNYLNDIHNFLVFFNFKQFDSFSPLKLNTLTLFNNNYTFILFNSKFKRNIDINWRFNA